MIVYEREDVFVMVEQDAHARLSGELAKHWSPDLFVAGARRADIEWGIAEHDRGWIGLDHTPLWNDARRAPYSFMDLPSVLKLPHYREGIDAVERENPYAALICSHHYASFFAGASDPLEVAYRAFELARQERLLTELGSVDPKTCAAHVELLKFLDRLSIYVCINEPGASKENEFFGYRGGFVNSETYPFTQGKKILARWLDTRRLGLTSFPFSGEFEASVPIRVVSKSLIEREGLAKATHRSARVHRTIQFVALD